MERRSQTAGKRPAVGSPGLFWWLGVVLLVGSVSGTQWFLSRPKPTTSPTSNITIDQLDVVAMGHIDSEFGVTSLSPTIPGRIVDLPITEGMDVEDQQVLLRLDNRLAKSRYDEAKNAERAGLEALAQAEKFIELYHFKIDQQTAAVDAAKSKLAAAKLQYQHREELRKLNMVSQTELDASGELIKEATQLLNVEKSRLDELGKLDIEAKKRIAQIELDSVRIKVKQAEDAMADFVLRAPRAGRILRLYVSLGDMISPASPQPAILFIPKGKLIVRAEVEQEFSGRVCEGMKATIRDDSRAEAHEWSGKVLRLSDWIARRRSIVFEPGAVNDVRTLECIVEVQPDEVPLRIGQRVRVTLHAEK